jgi:bacillithiol synthase
MKSELEVPFRDLPHQSKLFLSYLEGAPAALAFYRHPPELESLMQAARIAAAEPGAPREEMARILVHQNESFGAGQETLENAQALAAGDAVAIVTGQQVGLFGGPLYTVYKAMTALYLASVLRNRGIPAIPIFWMDAEDHDLAEVTQVAMARPHGIPETVDLRPRIFADLPEEGRPVGSIPLPGGIHAAIREYAATIPESQWKDQIVAGLKAAYAPEVTFALAFARLITTLFAGTGLVVFDPQDPEAKRLAAPLFQSALGRASEIRAALQERSGQLEAAGFAAQVKVLGDSTVLFLIDQGRRRALTLIDGRFALKNSDAPLDFQDPTGRPPACFSPNVLLRPVVQDWLFPTAAYVAGPAETVYFAQVEAVYRLLKRPMPVIWPRAACTLIGPEIAEILQQSRIRLRDCFQDRQMLVQKIASAAGLSRTEAALETMEATIREKLDRARPIMASVDASLDQAADTAMRKMLHHVDAIRGKFARLEAGRNGENVCRADRVIGSLYPNGNLQEREWGVQPFLAQYGPSLLERIEKELNRMRFIHQVIYL